MPNDEEERPTPDEHALAAILEHLKLPDDVEDLAGVLNYIDHLVELRDRDEDPYYEPV